MIAAADAATGMTPIDDTTRADSSLRFCIDSSRDGFVDLLPFDINVPAVLPVHSHLPVGILRRMGDAVHLRSPPNASDAMTLLSDPPRTAPTPTDLEAFWMPFTANRQFKSKPRMMTRAEGMYYWTDTGKKILDGFAGLWCCNAGHGRKPIVEAIQKQAATMDYAPAFQMGHPLAFELANRIVELAPGSLDHVFFCNSGSEAVDSALKIAIAWHRVQGRGERVRLIGRERGYHGVGFGGISIGGIPSN